MITDAHQPRSGEELVVGVDYGTLSGRAVVVRVADGEELGSAVHPYRHAVMDATLDASSGATLPPDWALQSPADYVEVLETAVPAAIEAAGVDPARVIGIGTDFTACTILPVRDDGTPLSALEEFRDEPHAWVKLWKHHAAQGQADRINALAHDRAEPWISRYGGKLSSEWALAKGLELFEDAREVYEAMDHWVEAADWIVWRLTGSRARNACTAGYKEVRQDGTYPSAEFLEALAPGFGGFFADKVAGEVAELGSRVGSLTAEAAALTGLPEGIAVCAGNVDAHVAAPASRATEPGQMLLVMGTSTCHVMNGERLAEVPGMCGVVDGGIVAGLYGYEAGQSGVGDIFAWWIDNGVPADVAADAEASGLGLHEHLTAQAAQQPIGGHGLIALDWLNGNRSVLVDHELSGVVVGLTLATRPHEIYRALLESTAYGTRRIIEAFDQSGVPVAELVITGGLVKNELLMQIYADVTRRPLRVSAATQGPALGAAMHAAVAAGAHADIHAAADAMGAPTAATYTPAADAADAYDTLYAEYRRLHEYFGEGGNDVMHRLRDLRRKALSR